MPNVLPVLAAGCLVLAVSLWPASARAASNPVNGSAKGKAVFTIIPDSQTCTTPAAQNSDYLCHYNLRGAYTTDSAYLGSGRYSGRVVLDSRNYVFNDTYNENCYFNFVGIVKFSNDQGLLRTKVAKTQSFICDSDDTGTIKDVHLVLKPTVGGNTGIYTNVTGGTINWDGTPGWTQTPTIAPNYKDAETFAGSVDTQ